MNWREKNDYYGATHNAYGGGFIRWCWGLSLGANWAGITTKYAVEVDKSAAATYKNNHPNCNVLSRDIANVSKVDMPIESPFVLFGGPPCQGFSASNRKTRTLDNLKNALFKHFIRIVSELKPRWVVFENVQGIVSFQNGLIITEIIKELEKMKYSISKDVLDAVCFGVPQYRKRFILVANNANIQFIFPQRQENLTFTTVKEAIGDLPLLKNGEKYDVLNYKGNYTSKYIQFIRRGSLFPTQNHVSKNKDYVINRYKYIRQGQNWQAIPEHLMRNYANKGECHSGIYRRLCNSKPSVVISNYRKNMLIHPTQNRGLSVREAARLQSFPDTFKFYGTITEVQQQIGNAVPPLLAKVIFDRIIEYEE
ncbi:MAG: DNA cytosine methyltransferase [Treponema sp.]|nr:DNA cytosine methyltransferase [Treponema sp.]